MNQSKRLRVSDLKNTYRLIGESRDLGHDPVAWRSHALEGTRRLVGAQVILGGVARIRPTALFEFPLIIDFGWEGAAEREIFLRFMSQGGAGNPRVSDELGG